MSLSRDGATRPKDPSPAAGIRRIWLSGASAARCHPRRPEIAKIGPKGPSLVPPEIPPMEALVRASVALRRIARRGLPVAVALALSGLLVAHAAAPLGAPIWMAGALAWAVMIVLCGARRLRSKEGDAW